MLFYSIHTQRHTEFTVFKRRPIKSQNYLSSIYRGTYTAKQTKARQILLLLLLPRSQLLLNLKLPTPFPTLPQQRDNTAQLCYTYSCYRYPSYCYNRHILWSCISLSSALTLAWSRLRYWGVGYFYLDMLESKHILNFLRLLYMEKRNAVSAKFRY